MRVIGPGQKRALEEAYAANRNTEDVDFAVTKQALIAFHEAAEKDDRFTFQNNQDWIYKCRGAAIEQMQVPLEFLLMGGGFVAVSVTPRANGDSFIAELEDLAEMKATTYQARQDDKDRQDFEYLLKKMDSEGQKFARAKLEEDDIEDLRETAKDCGKHMTELLLKLLPKA
ncbi:MAG: hypothetical protein M1814_003635 [Vezdaea aestivalis]|nr:MAG: hypothetical protein M1814_003635 [Vezdaea aestivalis]